MSEKTSKIEHPHANEGLTTVLNRFVDEMDFKGQENARMFSLAC